MSNRSSFCMLRKYAVSVFFIQPRRRKENFGEIYPRSYHSAYSLVISRRLCGFLFNREGAKRTSEKYTRARITALILLLFLGVSAVFYSTAKAQRELRSNIPALASQCLFSCYFSASLRFFFSTAKAQIELRRNMPALVLQRLFTCYFSASLRFFIQPQFRKGNSLDKLFVDHHSAHALRSYMRHRHEGKSQIMFADIEM